MCGVSLGPRMVAGAGRSGGGGARGAVGRQKRLGVGRGEAVVMKRLMMRTACGSCLGWEGGRRLLLLVVPSWLAVVVRKGLSERGRQSAFSAFCLFFAFASFRATQAPQIGGGAAEQL